jgi:hypothetical protein
MAKADKDFMRCQVLVVVLLLFDYPNDPRACLADSAPRGLGLGFSRQRFFFYSI